jgi:hypothetical protein
MNPSIQHLIQAVVASLENEVLPHLEAQATPASNVRACLMLLANIETRVTHEAKLLFDDNRELRVLLQDAAANAASLGLDDGLRRALLAALAQHPEPEAFFDAGLAAQANRDFQELLTQTINRLPMAKGDKAEFRRKLHRYLEGTGKREMQLAEKALGRVPV